jgi:iron(II)-dependent oxidoreductase
MPDPASLRVIEHARRFTGRHNRDWEPHVTTFTDLSLPDLRFCLVPVGAFTMGNAESLFDEEKPAHDQQVMQPYWIGQAPVTNAQWQQAVQAGVVASPHEIGEALKWYHDPAQADAPVVGVDWHMARAFADWQGCRLPTEVEWEFAVRGVESWIYPWGNEWNAAYPVWSDNSGGRPVAVTSHAEGQSWIGALHLSGNVWEWSGSRFAPYPYRADDGREQDVGMGGDVRCTLRGGSWWASLAEFLHAACRGGEVVGNSGSNLGLRLARACE